MSSQIFPSVEQLVDLLLGEMPSGVFADDRADDPDLAKRSYSSAEIRAHATMLAQVYANLSQINKDKFLSTVTHDGLTSWEKNLFSYAQDGSQSDSVRQSNLLTKYRSTGGISKPFLQAAVASILDPLGIPFDLATWNGDNNGAWILDETELDVGTYLAPLDPLMGARRDMTPLDCNLDYAAAGLTLAQLRDIQATAYTYDLRIYGTADSATLAKLDDVLTRIEPARSTHVILNNFAGPVPP